MMGSKMYARSDKRCVSSSSRMLPNSMKYMKNRESRAPSLWRLIISAIEPQHLFQSESFSATTTPADSTIIGERMPKFSQY